VRRLVKDGHTKQIVVNWTPDLFVVNRVIIPRNKLLERRRYMLQNEDEKTLTKNVKPCLFYASELMQYHGEGGEPSVSMEQALVLNGVEPSRTDVEY
jgi:hypothetical protein